MTRFVSADAAAAAAAEFTRVFTNKALPDEMPEGWLLKRWGY